VYHTQAPSAPQTIKEEQPMAIKPPVNADPAKESLILRGIFW